MKWGSIQELDITFTEAAMHHAVFSESLQASIVYTCVGSFRWPHVSLITPRIACASILHHTQHTPYTQCMHVT